MQRCRWRNQIDMSANHISSAISSLTDPCVVSDSVPSCDRSLSRQHRTPYIIHNYPRHDTLDSAEWQENATTSGLSERGPNVAAEDRQPLTPPPQPKTRALDHPSNLLHECTQSATHQRASADMVQTGGIRWDYHPHCPLLFWCPSLANSPPTPSSSILSSPAYPALAVLQTGSSLASWNQKSSPQ